MPVHEGGRQEKSTRDQTAWLDLLCHGGREEVSLPLLSGSMAPALLPGDILGVQPREQARCHAGDIVVIRSGKRLVAHRLIFAFRARGRALLVEKGDANLWPSFFPSESLIGTVVSAERDGRVVFSHSPRSRAEGRRIAHRSILKFLLGDMAINLFRRMIGREV